MAVEFSHDGHDAILGLRLSDAHARGEARTMGLGIPASRAPRKARVISARRKLAARWLRGRETADASAIPMLPVVPDSKAGVNVTLRLGILQSLGGQSERLASLAPGRRISMRRERRLGAGKVKTRFKEANLLRDGCV
jgi:hypothetical protein